MRVVSVEELVTQKILPFNLYNQDGEIIFSAGEVLTPGKLLQLRYISVLYREDEEEPEEEQEEQDEEEQEEQEEEVETVHIVRKKEKKPVVEETDEEDFDDDFDRDEDDDIPFENEISCIPVRTQKDIKALYKKAVQENLTEGTSKNPGLYLDTRDKIVEEVLPIVDDVIYKSQLRIFGDFDYAHGINVSILATILAYKLRFNENQIRDIALGAMLHDIGKSQIPKDILDKTTLTAKETKLIQLHPQIGYKMLKKELGLPEHIAKIALEHHERNDGSGYPYAISGDLISAASQIVIVCDVYDTLVSNRGHIKVKNSKEALRAMLEIGSKWFTPNLLYTFVHMSNYNDTTPLLNS